MPKYVLDTNLYIQATRSAASFEALRRFLYVNTAAIHLHSVVALELLAGATTEKMRRWVERSFIRPIERRERVFTPTHDASKRAAGVLASLVRDRRVRPKGIKKSLVNDCVIAASARDHGFVLVTDNIRDFALISDYLPIEFVPPWPISED